MTTAFKYNRNNGINSTVTPDSGAMKKNVGMTHSPSSSHPAAPPRQRSSFCFNLFRKRSKSKSKRIHSSPPLPPPPKKGLATLPYCWENISFSEEDDDLPSGSESPPRPLRPLPPPLGIGEYSSATENDERLMMICGGKESGWLSPSGFCPSPDPNVDSKTDEFIAQFHQRLREENLNFARDKERSRVENISFSEEDDDLPSASESPPSPIRPLPPPLGIGEYSSDTENDERLMMIRGGKESGWLSPSGFCPSPDPNVDSKTDEFIAQFHQRLREENLNFARDKERSRVERAGAM